MQKRWVIDMCMDAGLGCSSRFTTGELRKFLGRKKIEMDRKMADPGSLNLASKGGTVTLDTMKLLGISAGAFRQNSVSAAISAKANFKRLHHCGIGFT